MTTTATPVDNGVNVEALLGARAALQDAPEAAQFTWRATNTWIRGTHSESTVTGFFGLGAEQEADRSFTTSGDHPPQFAAENNGPTPVETLLTALGGCLTAGVAAVAQQRGIQLNSVTASIEGDHDIRGILGGDPDVRNGFNEIRVTYAIDADASPEDIQALVAQSQKRSAVFDALTNPTAVTVSVA
ncbi:MAG: OsmC family protein [Nocardioides sp.]|uniref:OsmC family protein n=1 Tax=Nocardioides sp. TaxID=35761 RepID=UPI0039E63068